ncbi:MAG TPA: DUF1194 domain-containing protein [Beijerinckiaceae bacterium]|jgi:hypothetical protein
MSCLRSALIGFVLVAGVIGSPARATEVDLALVIAVDISYSMEPDEQQLQREGFAEAFRSPLVHEAIRGGVLGRIAVTYLEWAGEADQRVVLPWTVIDNPESVMAFAGQIDAIPLRRAQRTSISGAIDAAAKLFDNNGLEATRRVIDVSGDGANNQGRPVVAARDEALARGLIINGLPIMLKQPGFLDVPELDIYYRDCVIGGPGAFMIPARDRAQFQDAIKNKILLEVAGGFEAPLLRHAQTQTQTRQADCMTGEMQWRERIGN